MINYSDIITAWQEPHHYLDAHAIHTHLRPFFPDLFLEDVEDLLEEMEGKKLIYRSDAPEYCLTGNSVRAWNVYVKSTSQT